MVSQFVELVGGKYKDCEFPEFKNERINRRMK